MAEQTLKEKTAKGLFWGGISNGMQQLLGVLIGIVLLKNLTPDDYGMVGMLAIFTAIASTIQESGFTAALTNRPEFKAEDYNSVFWFNLVVGSVIYVFLFFSAPLIAHFYKQPELILLSRVLFLSIVIGTLGIAHNAFLFKQLMVKERAKIDIFSTLISGVFGIILALKGFGYWALAVQTLVASSMGTILRWYFSPWRPSFSFNFRPIKEMFSFSFKMLIATIVSQVQANIYSVLLGRFYTQADVGYFSQGVKWAGMGTQSINGMIYSVAQPLFVKVQGDKEKEIQVLRKMMRFISLVGFPLLLGLSFVCRDFVTIINVDFLPCVPILQIFCVWGCVALFYTLFLQILIAKGDSSFYFKYILFTSIGQIIVAVLVYPLGIYYLAFINLLVFSFFFLVLVIYITRFISIPILFFIYDIAPFLLMVLGSILFAWIFVLNIENSYFKIFSKILIVSCSYILLLWLSSPVIFKEVLCFIIKKNK
ncbi:lipopolysaccharide biosynthesis protein [Parabacteroides sp. AM08-6]|uniref:lipopolysaccharide biosynthesis protein n=1 Tax=Parabacteroides sp. AM08-6 TaxID=2292053 RepID=UPI000EFF2A63|nr:lipopolysaccharide biosynthesis protein [Parabacteroides sp. AM08-6]RHJ79752.1 lipopolysaccharide biosynthesis protein [Parabacteroides sp. AM08-6]